jgi:hypothetical protein
MCCFHPATVIETTRSKDLVTIFCGEKAQALPQIPMQLMLAATARYNMGQRSTTNLMNMHKGDSTGEEATSMVGKHAQTLKRTVTHHGGDVCVGVERNFLWLLTILGQKSKNPDKTDADKASGSFALYVVSCMHDSRLREVQTPRPPFPAGKVWRPSKQHRKGGSFSLVW